jgi:hypothetical protein
MWQNEKAHGVLDATITAKVFSQHSKQVRHNIMGCRSKVSETQGDV